MDNSKELMYSKYLRVCERAISDDEVYKTFRSDKLYCVIVGHCHYDLGLRYYNETRKNAPELLRHIEKFAESEKIGDPERYSYDGVVLSPTTLRYVKVLSDLVKIFGSLNGLDIVEIGCGYGGQCKIIHDVFKPRSYTIVDLDPVLALAKKFLAEFDIHPIFRSVEDESDTAYDLFISNYAFSEVDRKYQDRYAEHIIENSKRGYMTINFMDYADEYGRLNLSEILDLKYPHQLADEVPRTCVDNFLYMW